MGYTILRKILRILYGIYRMYGIYRTRSPYVEKECRRSCRDGVLTLEVRAVRKPIHARATKQLYSQSIMIPSL